MKPNFLNPLYRPAETEKPAAGAPAAKAPASNGEGETDGAEKDGEGEEEGEGSDGEDPEPEKEKAPAASTAKLGMFDRAALHLKSKNAVITLLGEAHKFNGQLAAENAQLRTQLATAEANSKKVATLEKKVAAAEAEKTTVSKEVTKTLTSLGIAEKDAPAMAASGNGEALLEQFNSLKGAQKIAFFRANEAALMAADAASQKAAK